MTTEERRRLRAALRIHDGLTRRDESPMSTPLPLDAWRNLERAARLAAHAERRGWAAAAEAARGSYRRTAAELSDRLSASLRAFEVADTPRSVQRPREVLADLDALEEEFDGVEVNLRENTVSVTTDAVVLEGVDLGRFEIVLHSVGTGDLSYDAVALAPNPAASEETTTHPHVRDDCLCEGDGQVPIRRALGEGRLLDFFLLVRQVLTTYNPGSAYVSLKRWHGDPCGDCGYTGDDEATNCDCCSASLCLDCRAYCSACDRDCCGDCREPCCGCDETCCPACLSGCRDCGAAVCGGCETDGRCDECRIPHEDPEPHTDLGEDHDDVEHEEVERQAADAETGTSVPEGDASGLAVHAVRLGEAPVPA